MRTGIVIVAVAAALGLGYGYASGLVNQNPYYPRPGEMNVAAKDWAAARHWQPSPVYLPSYLVCTVPRNGLGISHTKSGYLFRSAGDRRLYLAASALVGGVLIGVPGVAAALLVRARARRRAPQARRAV